MPRKVIFMHFRKCIICIFMHNYAYFGGGHRYLDTWIPKICQVSKKKVSKSIQEYPKVSIFVSFFVDQSHPLNQLSTSSLEF